MIRFAFTCKCTRNVSTNQLDDAHNTLRRVPPFHIETARLRWHTIAHFLASSSSPQPPSKGQDQSGSRPLGEDFICIFASGTSINFRPGDVHSHTEALARVRSDDGREIYTQLQTTERKKRYVYHRSGTAD